MTPYQLDLINNLFLQEHSDPYFDEIDGSVHLIDIGRGREYGIDSNQFSHNIDQWDFQALMKIRHIADQIGEIYQDYINFVENNSDSYDILEKTQEVSTEINDIYDKNREVFVRRKLPIHNQNILENHKNSVDEFSEYTSLDLSSYKEGYRNAVDKLSTLVELSYAFENDIWIIDNQLTALLKNKNKVNDEDIMERISWHFSEIKTAIVNSSFFPKKDPNLQYTINDVYSVFYELSENLACMLSATGNEFYENKYTSKFRDLCNDPLTISSKLFSKEIEDIRDNSDCFVRIPLKKPFRGVCEIILVNEFKIGIELGTEYHGLGGDLIEYGVIFKDTNNHHHLAYTAIEAFPVITEAIAQEFDYKLRKNPTLNREVKKYLEINSYDCINSIQILVDYYMENQQVFSANGLDLSKKMKDVKKFNIEHATDELKNFMLDYNTRQLAQSIASNKYRHLYDYKTQEIFKELYTLGVSKAYIQDNIGRKLAAFNTPEDFNNALRKVVQTFNGFDERAYIEKANRYGADIVSNSHDILVLQIDNFDQSNKLGSPSWCISRDQYYFDSYCNTNSVQFFMYDFSKDITDTSSMIGITYGLDNGKIDFKNIKAAHYKNDSSIDYPDLLDAISERIKNALDNNIEMKNNKKVALKNNTL